ncbi:putative PAS domain S-box protein [Azospirillaceae bacterium]
MNIENILDIQNKTVSVLKSSVYTEGFLKLIDQFGVKVKIIDKSDYKEILQSIDEGDVDAGITPKIFGVISEKKYNNIQATNIIFTPIKIFYAAPKEKNRDIIDALDIELSRMKSDDNSVYYNSLNHWMGFYKNNPKFPIWVVWVFGMAVALIVFFFSISVVLRQRIREKVLSLGAANERSRKFEKAQEESEKRFRAIFELSHDSIAVTQQTKFFMVNPAFVQLFGYSSLEDVLSRSVLDTIAPREHYRILDYIRRRDRKEDAPLWYKTMGIRSDGVEFEIDVRVSPIVLDNQDYTVSIIRDNTERQRMERQRQHQMAVTLSLLNLSKHAEASDIGGLVQFCLDEINILTGSVLSVIYFNNEDQDGISLMEWISIEGNTRQNVFKEYCPIEKTGLWATTFRHKKPIIVNQKDGLYLYGKVISCLSEYYAPIQRLLCLPIIENNVVKMALGVGNKPEEYDEDDIEMIQIIGRDLWKTLNRRRAEIAQIQSEERFRTIYEAVNDAILIYDFVNHAIVDCNSRFSEFLGYSKDEMIAMEINVFSEGVFPYDQNSARQWIAKAAAGAPQIFEWQLRHKSGEVVWGEISLRRASLDGKDRLLIVVRDISQRKDAEQKLQNINISLERLVSERTAELQRANKELEAFSYSVSHDLRAPLRGIDGWSMALLEDFGSQFNEEAREYLNCVRAETQRMGELIDAQLQLSRFSRFDLNKSKVSLSTLAKNVATSVQNMFPGRTIEFIIQSGLYCYGDARLINALLMNLFDNACKFTAPRSVARIEFGRTDIKTNKICAFAFFVRDNGVGYDMRFASKLFSAFQRLHKPTEFPGTGIGLATVQRIVLRHGGQVWAEAEVDQGATFYFTLGEGS